MLGVQYSPECYSIQYNFIIVHIESLLIGVLIRISNETWTFN